MKYKKRVALISLAAMLLMGFGIYAFINQEKKAYDYSDFYVPVESEKPTATTDASKEPEEPSQSFKQVIMIIMLDATSILTMPVPVFLLFPMMEISILLI